VHLRLIPHLIVFAVSALLLGLGADNAFARQGVLLPAVCDHRDGRLIVQASQPTAHEIVSELKRQVFSACRPGRSDRCRPMMVYQFEVACGAVHVSWMDLATALLSAGGTSAWIEGERLHIRPRSTRPRLGDCDSGDPTNGFLRKCEPWELDELRGEWVLPPGFAPVHEVGARFVDLPPPAEPPLPEPEVAAFDNEELQASSDSEAVSTGASSIGAPADSTETLWASDNDTPAVAQEDIAHPHPQSDAEVETAYEPFDATQSPSEGNGSTASIEHTDTHSFVRNVSEAIAAAASAEPETVVSTAEAEPASSVRSWSAMLEFASSKTFTWLSESFLSAFDPLAAALKDPRLEKEVTAALMGIALLSCLVSGIGWYSVRARRARAPAFRAADGRQPVVHTFRPPSRSEAESRDAAGQASASTALVAPTDEKICGELCRTAHTLLQQIEVRVDDLQGVAPLRRVLQREMRGLEQFLTAVMTASPQEPEEWRRMRNRLQRIVRELHRLRDIVEGAYRSLSTGGFTSREPPRDKYEAYEALGVNPDVDLRTLKKLVDALRACWHPDLAKDETDRANREERMKRINIAWDIITSKRQEA